MNGSPWWRIGWRNLGRNRKRTALTALGLAIGYFAVVLMVGWGEGMVAELIENATSLVSGQIEIMMRAIGPNETCTTPSAGATARMSRSC